MVVLALVKRQMCTIVSQKVDRNMLSKFIRPVFWCLRIGRGMWRESIGSAEDTASPIPVRWLLSGRRRNSEISLEYTNPSSNALNRFV